MNETTKPIQVYISQSGKTVMQNTAMTKNGIALKHSQLDDIVRVVSMYMFDQGWQALDAVDFKDCNVAELIENYLKSEKYKTLTGRG